MGNVGGKIIYNYHHTSTSPILTRHVQKSSIKHWPHQIKISFTKNDIKYIWYVISELHKLKYKFYICVSYLGLTTQSGLGRTLKLNTHIIILSIYKIMWTSYSTIYFILHHNFNKHLTCLYTIIQLRTQSIKTKWVVAQTMKKCLTIC